MMRLISIATYRLVCLALLALAAGCDSGEKLYPVTGRVTHNGRAVAQGTVMFYPQKGRASMAQLESDGTFRIEALPGEHRVSIESTRLESPPATPITNEEERARYLLENQKIVWVVPEKYARHETSPLTARVESKENTINFDLPN